MTHTIDLNCDMGESFGAWGMGEDEAVMPFISSASIACGFHAGDPVVMQATVALALRHRVAVGAHVSLPDLQGFGRREMRVTPAEVRVLTLYQVGALDAFARTAGTRVDYVKPHGALYNMAARDPALAEAIAGAVHAYDPRLVLYALSGSALLQAGQAAGLTVAAEAFADRSYEPDGTLTPRAEQGAVFETPEQAAAQALSIVVRGAVTSRGGVEVAVPAQTLCVHGDRPHAAAFARALRQALARAGVQVAPPRRAA